MTGASFNSFGGGCRSKVDLARLASNGIVLVCLVAAGCGASSRAAPKVPAAQRVCAKAGQAARGDLGQVVMQIANPDSANIECVLTGRQVQVDTVAQAATQAWTEYSTAVVHQSQAFGSGPTYTPAQLPKNVSIRGAQASWIPAKSELIATNGTESTAGSYVTVTLQGRPPRRVDKATLTRDIGAAVLAVAPRGSSPGPPPS